MSASGKFIYKKFKNQVIEIFSDIEADWVNYNETTLYNHFTVIGLVNDYDDETGILELKNTNGQIFYINSDEIHLFWPYKEGFNILHNLNKLVEGGKNYSFDKDKHKEKVDQKFNQHLARLKKPKIEEI